MNFLQDIPFYEYYTESEEGEVEEQLPEPYEGELYPVFVVNKSTSESDTYNDGRKKSPVDMDAVFLHKLMKFGGGGDNYEHTLLSFDISLKEMYSFGPDGFERDSIDKDSYMGTSAIYVCVQFVKKDDYVRMKDYVKYLTDNQKKTSYAFGNILQAFLGTSPLKNSLRFFCSSFTGFILNISDNKNVHRDFSLLRPEDATILPRTFFLAVVKDQKEWREKLLGTKEKLNEIFRDHEKEIREYNNELPKLKLQKVMQEKRWIDKILDSIILKAKSLTLSESGHSIRFLIEETNKGFNDFLYFGSQHKHEKLRSKKNKLFLTPSKGISSIFVINRDEVEEMLINENLPIDQENPPTSLEIDINFGYEEWKWNLNRLDEPLPEVHIVHNVPEFKKPVSGTSTGFIHKVQKPTGNLELFVTKDPDREMIYTGNEELTTLEAIPHTIKWTCRFSPEKMKRSGRGHFKISYNESVILEDGDEENPEEDKKEDILDEKLDDSTEKEEENKEDDKESGEPSEDIEEKPSEETEDEPPKEIPEEQEEPKEEEKESFPKQIDREEKDKNGIRRKKLYIAFIEWAKKYNPKNTFGSVFDKDVFHVTYPFVPHDMRYFYRLANPILCVLSGKLTFFQLSELKKLNSDNHQLADMMIFAATEKDIRVFSNKDLKVYLATIEGDKIKLGRVLGNTFDTYIQSMIKQGDILNGPIDEDDSSDE